jgi:hypothetical protein
MLFAFFCLTAGNAHATTFTLTINVIGSGSVSRYPTNSPLPSGVTVTLAAISNDPSWYFSGWSGDATGSDNPLNVGMDSNKVITATFLQLPSYTLTLATNGQGGISLNPPGGVYLSNSLVTVTASSPTGWVFASWSGSTNGNANPLSLTMNTNNSLTGAFAQLPAFDTQPFGVTNVAGSTVSFTSHAVGNAPLGYQWFFSGGSINNATNTMLTTLTLTNVQSANADNYWIIATNSYGSATSSVVALVITNSIRTTNIVNSPDEASLRAAIRIGGWVSLACNGTITLSNTINITNRVILDARNVSLTISGGNAVRLFYVAPGASLSATNLTLANGSCIVTNGPPGTPADAGAIYNDGGTVTLVGCTLANNNAQSLTFGGLARGGAIFNKAGALSLFQSAISNSAVIGNGPYNGAPLVTNIIGIGLGGAIYNTNGVITIAGCNISSNLCEGIFIYSYHDSTALSMGGAVFQASGSTTISNSTFASNLALGSSPQSSEATGLPAGPAYGGALAASGGSMVVGQSQFLGNIAKGGDAGYHGAGGSAFGGAVYSAATLTVQESSFFGNQSFAGNYTVVPTAASIGTSGFGGAIYNLGTALLNRCSVYSNYVQGGSAIGYGPGGSAANGGGAFGGGIFNAAQMAATNCTVALNSAVGAFGDGQCGPGSPGIGINGTALGGGAFNNTGATFIAMNLTIAGNSCISPPPSSGGCNYNNRTTNGIAAGSQIANTNGTLRLHNSIIAYGGTNGNAYGTITDDGFNISSDGSANLFGGSSYNYTDPKLASLGDYGGPTACIALLSSSPAIDFSDSAGLPGTDQRGFVRPVGDGPDMGAYEYGSYLPGPPTGVPGVLNLTANGNDFLLSFTTVTGKTCRLQASTNLITWSDLNTNGPFATATNISQAISPQGFDRRFFRLLLQ